MAALELMIDQSAEQLPDEIRAASDASGTRAQPYLPLWIAVRGRLVARGDFELREHVAQVAGA
jgi:hypothetical protein